MASLDIYDFVFYDLLKYDTSSSVLTGELQNDVIFGLMVPTIFILIVLLTGVKQMFGDSHKSVGYLASITGLGVIMTLGWVPIIAGLGGFVFVLALIGYFIAAFYRRIISHGHEKVLVDNAKKLGGAIDMGNYALTKRDYRHLATELRNAEREFGDACTTLEALQKGIMRPQNSITVGDTKNQAARQQEIKSLAIDTAEEVIGQVPKGKRLKFIEDNVKINKEFKRELDDLFRIKDGII